MKQETMIVVAAAATEQEVESAACTVACNCNVKW